MDPEVVCPLKDIVQTWRSNAVVPVESDLNFNDEYVD